MIQLKSKLRYSSEDSLLSVEGRIQIFKRERNTTHFLNTSTIDRSANYQINRKLFLSGGSRFDGGTKIYSIFSSIDYSGIRIQLQPMKQERTAVSLSGLPSRLIALGGWRGHKLRAAEMYQVKQGKWVGLRV